MKIRQRAFDSIRAHGAKGFPHEICGLLIGDPAEMLITEARPVRNVETQNPDVRYLIDDKEDMRIRKSLYKTDLDVLGYYHSHPNHPAAPSEFDRSRASPWYAYFIVGVTDGTAKEITAWRLEETTKQFLPEEILVRGTKARSRESRKKSLC